MKIITGPRASGKTTKAIELANEQGAYLVVRNKETANRIYHDGDYPDLDRFPITYDELMNGIHEGTHIREVVIDNMYEFVQRAAGGLGVVAGTVTPAEVEELE